MLKMDMKVALAAVVILSVAVACAAPEAPTPTPKVVEKTVQVVVTATPPPKPETVSVVFWSAHGGALGEVLQDLVYRFNSLQDEVHVVNEFQGNYYETLQKFLAAMAAEKVPDIVMLDAMYTPFLAANGAYANLDEYVNGPDGVDVSDIPAGYLDADKWNGHFYSWSYARSTPVLFINADAFREAGLDPVPPATWDELVAAARKLVKKDASGEVVQYGFCLNLRNWWYLEDQFRSNGGRIFDEEAGRATLDEPEQLEVLEAIAGLIKEGVFCTAPDNHAGEADFLQGKVAMQFNSSSRLAGELEAATFELKVGFMPRWKVQIATPGGSVLAIPAASEKKAAAWKFLKWITSPEITGEYSMRTGYIPLRKSALETERLKAFYSENPLFKVAVDQAEYVHPLPLLKAVPVVPELFFQLQEEIFVGGAPVEETAKQYGETMTEEFQAWLKEMGQ